MTPGIVEGDAQRDRTFWSGRKYQPLSSLNSREKRFSMKWLFGSLTTGLVIVTIVKYFEGESDAFLFSQLVYILFGECIILFKLDKIKKKGG